MKNRGVSFSSASEVVADASARRPSPTRARVVHLSIDVPSYRTTRAVTVDARRVARRSSTRRVLVSLALSPSRGPLDVGASDHLGGSNAPSTVTLNDLRSMRLCGWVPSYRPGPGASDVRVAILADRLRRLDRPFGIASRARRPTSYAPGPGDAFGSVSSGARRGGFGSKRGSSLNTPPAPRRCDAARHTSGASYAPGPGVEDIESVLGLGSGSRGIPRANPPPARAGTEDFGTTSDDGTSRGGEHTLAGIRNRAPEVPKCARVPGTAFAPVVGSYRPGPGESRSPSANLGAAVNATPLVAPKPFFGGDTNAPRASPYAPGPGDASAVLASRPCLVTPFRSGFVPRALSFPEILSFHRNALGAAYDPGPGVGSGLGGSSTLRLDPDPDPFDEEARREPSSRRLRQPSCTASSFARRRASFARRSFAASGRSIARGSTEGRPEVMEPASAASRAASAASTRRRDSSIGGFGGGSSATAAASGGAVKNAFERRGRGRGWERG